MNHMLHFVGLTIHLTHHMEQMKKSQRISAIVSYRIPNPSTPSLPRRSLSLLAADSVLKETDKNSESFTVHRSLAQACFDPTPAATAAATPTATPYFNAIKIQKEGRRERDPKTKFLFRAIRWRDTPNVQELERNLLKKMSSPRFHFEKKLCSLNYYI